MILASSSSSRLLSAAAVTAAIRRSSAPGSVKTGCPEAEDEGPEADDEGPEAELSDRMTPEINGMRGGGRGIPLGGAV